MGGALSIFSRLWSKKEVRILILGLVRSPLPLLYPSVLMRFLG